MSEEKKIEQRDIFSKNPFANARISDWRYKPTDGVKLRKYAKCAVRGHRPNIDNFQGESSDGEHYGCLCNLWVWVVQFDSEKARNPQ